MSDVDALLVGAPIIRRTGPQAGARTQQIAQL